MLRRYFPDDVNDRFDADKIYEKVHKYIDRLHIELKKRDPKYKTIMPNDPVKDN